MPLGMTQNAGGMLFSFSSGLVGFAAPDGKEYIWATAPNQSNITALTVYNPSSVAITGGSIAGTTSISAPITGSAITGGTINNTQIGTTGPASVRASSYNTATFSDTSATPGAATHTAVRGRASFAAGASTVVITNANVTAISTVLTSLGSTDVSLQAVRTTPGAGIITFTGNAAAAAITLFDYLVIN